MSNININRLKAAARELELESLRQHGPQHGKAAVMQSKRDKARCPRRIRKTWRYDAE